MAEWTVRSALFTPGVDGSRLRSAIKSGADICIFDLEDSVEPRRLPQARATVAEAITDLGADKPIWVRVHPASSDEFRADLASLPLGSCAGLVLPKASGPRDLETCREALAASSSGAHMRLLPIIESAAGVVHVSDIAADPDVALFALGKFDLAADLNIDSDIETPSLIYARAAIVLASRSAGLPAPLDSPWLRIHDAEGLVGAAQRARRDGFGGMLLIHPSHVAPVHDAFHPSPDEVAWARSILSSNIAAAETGRGVYINNDAMVDEAIVRRARGILERSDS